MRLNFFGEENEFKINNIFRNATCMFAYNADWETLKVNYR